MIPLQITVHPSPIIPPRNFPPIHISATFVAAYNGKKPSIMIQNPVDLTEDIGTYFVDASSF